MDYLSTLEEDKHKVVVKELEAPHEVCTVKHKFSDKVYIREIFMPAGLLVVGKTHKTTHFNIITTGSCDVMIAGEIRTITAPATFESLEGSQKTLYIHEDCTWLTVHVNEDDERDIPTLEERYVEQRFDPQANLWQNIIKTLEDKQQ